jgi:hypothetical protein
MGKFLEMPLFGFLVYHGRLAALSFIVVNAHFDAVFFNVQRVVLFKNHRM